MIVLNIIGNLDDLINENIVNKRKDLHDIQMQAINTLMQNCMNDSNIDYFEKWKIINNLNQCQKSNNIFTIIKGAFSKNSHLSMNELSSDWLLDFWEKAQNISDDEFQKIWSTVLETEAESPGKISKKLLHQLYLMDAEDAKNFVSFSRFCFGDGGRENRTLYHPIIFIKDNPSAYKALGLDSQILENLQANNLIQCDYSFGYCFNERKKFFYQKNYIVVSKEGNIPAGNIKLTKTGQDLMNLIIKSNNEQIFNYTIDSWAEYGCSIQLNNRIL